MREREICTRNRRARIIYIVTKYYMGLYLAHIRRILQVYPERDLEGTSCSHSSVQRAIRAGIRLEILSIFSQPARTVPTSRAPERSQLGLIPVEHFQEDRQVLRKVGSGPFTIQAILEVERKLWNRKHMNHGNYEISGGAI